MEFIPIELYTPVYYYALLVVVILVFFHTQVLNLSETTNLLFMRNLGIVSLVFVLTYMGFRPLSQEFGDMPIYNRLFEYYKAGNPIVSLKDPVFHVFAMYLSKVVSSQFFFFICALLYVIPLYLVSKKWFEEYWFYSFLFLVISFSFWAYGVNGIRNGIATSLFLLGVSRKKILWQILWIILAINFHKSMLLPTAGLLLANLYNRPKKIIIFWFLCVILSLLVGDYFETLFATIGFDDERLSYFTTEANEEKFSSTGFRWDFLAYSASAIFAGWYYIVKKNYKDRIYFCLYNTYVFANAFWILVIRANFSNRFAYLSWFMLGLIIVYPLLRRQIIVNQHKKIGLILLIYFGFTFLMNVVLPSV